MPDKGRTKVSGDMKAAMVQRYAAGETAEALASEYGVVFRTVLNYAHAAGVPIRSRGGQQRKFPDDIAPAMAAEYAAGSSQAAIGRKYGCSQSVVSRMISGLVPFRPDDILRGELHGRWNGGKFRNGDGYTLVRLNRDDPLASMRQRNGYVSEHRLVMARLIGRPLDPSETVHHRNGDRTDNRPENLQLRQGKHGKGVVYRCRCCGSTDVETAAIDTPD